MVKVYEKEIYAAVLGERDEIEAQMDITEKLCKELNTSTKKAWLEMDNLVLDKLQKERNDLKVGNRWTKLVQYCKASKLRQASSELTLKKGPVS